MKPSKHEKRIVRHKRVRAKASGTASIPRVSIFRSNQHIFAQAIDDQVGRTLFSSKIIAVSKSKLKGTKREKAGAIGELLANQLLQAGIKQIVFDRGGYQYHGRVKAVAEGLRKGGIKF